MPTYEFRCQKCLKKFALVIAYRDYGSVSIACPHCTSTSVTRLIGRVRVSRQAGQHLADLADPANLDRIDDDPRALGRMMKEMKGEIGEEMGGEFDEVVDRLEKGQTPDEIEQSFPDPDGDGDAVG